MNDSRMTKILAGLVISLLVLTGAAFSSCRNTSPAPGLASGDAPSPAAQAVPPKADQTLVRQLSAAFEYAASRVSPAVVPIYAETVVKVQNSFGDDEFRQFFGDDFFRRFFGQPQGPSTQTVHSLGSGVIITADGYILTNNHVVSKAKTLSVILGDRQNQKRYSAKVIGTDPPTDLAVIKIAATGLPFASLGDSASVNVGQWVIAVGNPYQLMHTVTAGIISAKGRSSVGLADIEDFFQTDASINPGNSGGALADLDGNVIGINTAIETPSGGSVGVGFAIPINMAKRVMDQLISKGKVLRGYLDVRLQDLNEDLVKAMNLKSAAGVLVASVGQGGAADQAGVKQGDVIVGMDGKPVANTTELRDLVGALAPGAKAKLTVLRGGKEMDLTVTLGERPANLETEAQPEQEQKPLSSSKLGLTVQTLTPGLANQLGFRGEEGVVITAVADGSVADEAGLQRGDLIKEVNRQRIRTTADFEAILGKLKSGETVALLVQRRQSNFYVAITIH